MMDFIGYVLDVLLFLLLVLAYVPVIRAIPSLPALLLGLAGAILDRVLRKEIFAKLLVDSAKVMSLVGMLFFAALGVSLVTTDIWTTQLYSKFYSFWRSPIILTLLLLVSLHEVSHFKGYNPILRPASFFALLSVWPVVIIVLVGQFWPTSLTPTSAKWAGFTACCVMFLLVALKGTTIGRDIKTFEALNRRHDRLNEDIQKLKQKSSILLGMADQDNVQDALHSAEDSYKSAMSDLRQGRYGRVEQALLKGEAEIDGLNRLLEDRIHLSLKDELVARLNQALINCNSMKSEFKSSGLPVSDVNKIESRIVEKKEQLTLINFEGNLLAKQIEPYEDIFADIVAIRTALRLRSNFEASLDKMRNELDDSEWKMSLAKHLGKSTNVVENARENLSKLLTDFGDDDVESSEKLIEEYSRLRQAAAENSALINSMMSEIDSSWKMFQVADLGLIGFIPRSVSTKQADTGAIVRLNDESGDIDELKCELDGVLLELQSERQLLIPKSHTSPFTVTTFSFAGKRGGLGKLDLRFLEEKTNYNTSQTLTVFIKTPAIDSARDAFIFAAPSGGVLAWLLWQLSVNPTIATTFGAGFGGVVGLVVFLIQRMKQRTTK